MSYIFKYLFIRICYFLSLLLLLTLLSACNSKKVKVNDTIQLDTIATNQDIEIIILNTFMANETDEIKAKRILENIHLIDWSIYESISGNKAYELLCFLHKNMSNSDADMKLNFFRATKNLDGAYAEMYSAIVGDLFEQDNKSTINIISKIDPIKYEEMINYILQNFTKKDFENIRNNLEKLTKLDLTDNEKKIINMMIEKLRKN